RARASRRVARRRARRDRLGARRRARPRRDRAADRRRARRAPLPRGRGMTTTVSDIVLPDDPSFGPEVQVDYPGYRSTRLRAPKRPLVPLPEEFHAVEGPVFGNEAIGELDHDLTRQHDGEPLGERIVVTGRVLDDGGRPIRKALVEVWQANAAGRYRHVVDRHPAPLDPNFSGAGRCLTDDEGRYRFVTIKPGSYPWGNHENAWRPQHIHFSVFGPQ